MKKEIRIEMSFYRKGKLVGGSFEVFTGTEEEIRGIFNEDGTIIGEMIEFMARLAGVRNYDVNTLFYEIVNDSEDETDDARED